MGWSFCCDPRHDRAAIIRELTTDPAHHRTVDHAAVGNHLWTVKEYTTPSGETARYICLFLLQSGGRNSGWGHKDITESMGPCAVDCPRRLLELVPDPPNEWGRQWRERVREYHEAKAAKARGMKRLAVGQTVELAPGCTPSRVTIASLKPLRGYDATGRLYRIAPRHIAAPDPQPAQASLI